MEVTVRSYGDLSRFVEVFKTSDIQVLFILGEPGQSKSTVVKKAIRPGTREDGPQLIDGGDVSAFELYKRLWASRDEIFILDDCDQFYKDAAMIRLLKCLCQTEPVKRVGWHKHNSWMEANEIPKEFTTRTRVVIIANQTHEISKQVESLQDRGVMLRFAPPVQEVLAVGKTFRGESKIEKRVIQYVERNRKYIERLSLRTLINATKLMRSGITEWESLLAEDLGVTRLKIVEQLLDDKTLMTDVARAAKFNEMTRLMSGRMERTGWYEAKAKLERLKNEELLSKVGRTA